MAQVGDVVLYKLSIFDVEKVAAQRGSLPRPNPVHEGEEYPLVIVRLWRNEWGPGVDGANGQVFLDGDDVLWVTSVKRGEGPGTWRER